MPKRNKHKRTSKPLTKLATSSKPGQPKRHIIGATIDKGREYYLHATKGYRSR